MKNYLLIIIIILFSFSLIYSESLHDDTTNTEIDSQTPLKNNNIQDGYKEVTNKYNEICIRQETLLDHLEIQNRTIMNVSTIFAILLVVLIFYLGWKAHRMEGVTNQLRKEKLEFDSEYLTIKSNLFEKLHHIDETSNKIDKIKTDLKEDHEKIITYYKELVLNHANEVLNERLETMDKTTQEVDVAFKKDYDDTITGINNKLKTLEEISETIDPETLYKKVSVYLKSEQFNKCKILLEKLMKTDNFKTQYYFHYAFSLSELKEYEESEKFYLKYLTYYENDAAALNNLGVIYHIEKGNIIIAKEYFQKAWDIHKKNIYIDNLIKIADTKQNIMELYNEGFQELKEIEQKEQLQKKYYVYIENNFFMNEIHEYHKLRFEEQNNTTNYLNYYESAVLSKDSNTVGELNDNFESYTMSKKEQIMFLFLTILDLAIRGKSFESKSEELTILLSDISNLEISWKFNLIDKNITKYEFDETTIKYFDKTINILKSLKSEK